MLIIPLHLIYLPPSITTNLPHPIPSLPKLPRPAPIPPDKPGPLTDILLSTTSAANRRAEEATLVFQNIACVLDDAICGEHLPPYLLITLRNFAEDLKAVAKRHFENHLCGLPRPPAPYSSITTPLKCLTPNIQSTIPPGNIKHRQPRTYASTVALPTTSSSSLSQAKSTPKNLQPKSKSSNKHTQEDNRLLVRISAGHPALSMSPYAVMQQLNNYLEQKLVREIQNIKTGFAICPASSIAQEKLYTRINDIEAFLSTQGACKVEKPEINNAYR